MLKQYIEKYRTLSIIGMCKNAGKTTVLNRIIQELAGETLGLTSIGRDGESVDLVTNTAKPGIFVHQGTLFATAEDLLKLSDVTREILDTTGMNTPLGEVVLLRARSDGAVQLAGPSMGAQLTKLNERFFAFGATRVLIDGAISRKSLSAPAVSEATVLCTGASYHRDISVVVEDTAFSVELLTLPEQRDWRVEDILGKYTLRVCAGGEAVQAEDLTDGLRAHPKTRQIYVAGAVTDALIKPLLMSNLPLKNVEFTVEDGSKLLLTRGMYEKLKIRGGRLSVERTTQVAAVTVNPVSAYGFDFDRQELLSRMAERVDVPVLNVRGDTEL